MQKFTKIKSIAAYLPINNIDTDMIIPKQFLKTIKRTGLKEGLFYEMRFDESGKEIKDFVLNKAPYNAASILIAGENFGCGSSREHAPWALLDFGIRCVIAPSFADIFFNNCFNNGILPIALSKAEVLELSHDANSGANANFIIDLEGQFILSPSGKKYSFDVENHKKQRMLNGLDDIGITLKKQKEISAFEEKNKKQLPWLYYGCTFTS
jgi:3-isopropylmalate/(R)-2-methylmalate dehydratase small subunit